MTNVHKGRRARSRSPTSRQRPTRIREQLPRRETRRSSTLSLSSRDHRVPTDCPLPMCNATTVHQHYNNLQFFNPHPANEIQHRGYLSSHRVAPSQADNATGGLGMQTQEVFGPELSDEEAFQEQHEMGQTSVVEDDEVDDQEEPRERRTLVVTLRVAAPEERSNAQISVTSVDLWKEQQEVIITGVIGPEEQTVIEDGTSDLSPGDPITSRRTLDFVEDLLTPPQTIPMEIDYETVAKAWDSRVVHAEPQESPLTISPGLQGEFDKWLVPKTPEQASETLSWYLQSLGQPLHNPSQGDGDGKLPLLIVRSPQDHNMGPVRVTMGDGTDLESIFGHAGNN